MTYFEHLKANWKVAFHSFGDFLEHFIHGLFPCIKWEHQQPTEKGSATDTNVGGKTGKGGERDGNDRSFKKNCG